MRILDENGIELNEEGLDLSRGYLVQETIQTTYHEAVEAVEGVWHYEEVRKYDNGGRDLRRVWDVPPVAAREAYWETEDIQRYIPYTEEELEQRRQAEAEAKANELSWDTLAAAIREGVNAV